MEPRRQSCHPRGCAEPKSHPLVTPRAQRRGGRPRKTGRTTASAAKRIRSDFGPDSDISSIEIRPDALFVPRRVAGVTGDGLDFAAAAITEQPFLALWEEEASVERIRRIVRTADVLYPGRGPGSTRRRVGTGAIRGHHHLVALQPSSPKGSVIEQLEMREIRLAPDERTASEQPATDRHPWHTIQPRRRVHLPSPAVATLQPLPGSA